MAAPSGQAASICSPLYSTWQGRHGAPCEKLHDKLREEVTVCGRRYPITFFTMVSDVSSGILNPPVSNVCMYARSRQKNGRSTSSTPPGKLVERSSILDEHAFCAEPTKSLGATTAWIASRSGISPAQHTHPQIRSLARRAGTRQLRLPQEEG